MEQFKASDEDWLVIELNAKEKFGVAFAGLCDLRDRLAALEAAPDRVLVRNQTGEYLRAGTPLYLDSRNRLVSYSVGEAPPLEECGKDHAVPDPAAAPAAPAAAVPSDRELTQMRNEAPGNVAQGLRVVWSHGYQQGLAAGRAEQQAAAEATPEPEPSPSPAAGDAGLVEVIAEIIENEPILGRAPEEEWRPEARAAIRAVAKWLRSMGNFSAATNLEREANR